MPFLRQSEDMFQHQHGVISAFVFLNILLKRLCIKLHSVKTFHTKNYDRKMSVA